MTNSDPLAQLTNYRPISPLILTAGQPTAEQIALLAQAGCDVVINLALPSSPNALADEAELVATQGMDYIAIPVVWEEPTLDDLARFFAAMKANQARRVFVHCVVNYRVASFIYLYRMLRLGAARDEAIRDLRAVWEPDETWSAFIAAALETL
ncbi:MAG: protein tyrosine phosphatase family protein [Anaerolineae bacterium]